MSRRPTNPITLMRKPNPASQGRNGGAPVKASWLEEAETGVAPPEPPVVPAVDTPCVVELPAPVADVVVVPDVVVVVPAPDVVVVDPVGDVVVVDEVVVVAIGVLVVVVEDVVVVDDVVVDDVVVVGEFVVVVVPVGEVVVVVPVGEVVVVVPVGEVVVVVDDVVVVVPVVVPISKGIENACAPLRNAPL